MPTEPAEARLESSGEAPRCPGAFQDLVRGFLVLRDLFSYSLPGAVFLAIGLRSRMAETSALLDEIRKGPAWAVVLVGLLASYLAGHVLLSAYFILPNIRQILRPRRGLDDGSRYPQDTAEIVYRRRAPELFVELDRHRILSDMRRGLALALVLGVIFFRWWPDHWWDGALERLLVTAGTVVWISVLSGNVRGRLIRDHTLHAAQELLGERQDQE